MLEFRNLDTQPREHTSPDKPPALPMTRNTVEPGCWLIAQ
jgi:hypothetical protein